MKICWDKGKSSAKVIYVESLKDKKRNYVTVKTTLDRLVQKGFLERELFGPIWLYTPIVTEDSAVSRVVDDFASVISKKSIVSVVMCMVDKIKSKEDLKELKKLINDLHKKNKS